MVIQYLPSIVITAGNFVVPLLSDQIAVLERYSTSVTIILALMRFARGGLSGTSLKTEELYLKLNDVASQFLGDNLLKK